MNNIEGIRQLIAQERLDEALRALAELLPLHLQNDLILLKSRLTSLERDSRLYLIDINDARMERHRITTAALMLVKILGGNDVIHHSEEYILPISGTSSSLDSSTLSQQKGVIMHKIPRRMQINNLHRCIIRIAFDKDTILKNLPIYAKNGKFQPVRVSEKMEVSFKENEYQEQGY